MKNNTQTQPSLIKNLVKLQSLLFYDLFGPKIIPMRYIINTFKGATFLWVLFLMYFYQCYSNTIYLYLFLHGSYGILWIIKDITFPDQRFKPKASVGSSIICFVFLTLYWTIPLPMAMDKTQVNSSILKIITLIIIYITGLVLMLGSDYQKYVTLQKKKGLISSGFFKTTRNPNYLGQILIYSSFALCSNHMSGYLILYGLACPFFFLNMYLKDKTSLEKKVGWEQYKKKSNLIIPKIFYNNRDNYFITAFFINIIIWIIRNGTIYLNLQVEQQL